MKQTFKFPIMHNLLRSKTLHTVLTQKKNFHKSSENDFKNSLDELS